MAVRYIVQRALGGQVLTYNAPGVTEGERTRALSAAGSLTLQITSDQAAQEASDGQPLYQEWGSIVTVEEAGQIRFRGLVIKMSYGTPDWTLELASIATYPNGIPYEGEPFYGAKVDPADIVRMLWAHAQSFPDSDLGVTVTGSTPIRVGTYSTQSKADTLAAYNAAVKTYNAESARLKDARAAASAAYQAASPLRDARTAAQRGLTAAKKTKDPAQIAAAQATWNSADAAVKAQESVYAQRQADVNAQADVTARAKATKDAAYKAKVAASKQAKDDGGAYTLLWWEAPDCGSKITELADSTPFDWFEEHYWTTVVSEVPWAGMTEVEVPATRIRIMYPRLGRRLNGPGDPTFQQGVNISQPLAPETAGDDFANSVFGVGAGEGAGSIRRSVTKRNGRLRRVSSFSSKDIKSTGAMDTKLRAELNARLDTLEVKQITVADHPNSPRGSYAVGDDIYVQGRVPHYGRFQLWHRVLKITERTDGSSVLDLARSDSFTYGRGID